MVFEIDQSSLPFVRTRHALLALDLQIDFASPNGPLAVKNSSDLAENTVNLVSNFRSSGNVIWVRTVFESSRPVNVDGVSESVITDAELPVITSTSIPRSGTISRTFKDTTGNLGKSVAATEEDDENFDALAIDEEDQISECYLTLMPGQIPYVASPMLPGANFVDSIARSMEPNIDLVFQKSYYSAFRDGNLVRTLRAKLVTQIYICGALTNISVFATAMDAARHGYAITIVEDCLGYRSKARHDEALRKLEELTGCDIVSSKDLIRDIQERERVQKAQMARPAPKFSVRPPGRGRGRGATDLESLLANLSMRPEVPIPRPSAASPGASQIEAAPQYDSSEPAEEGLKTPQRTASTEVKRERVKSKVKTRRRLSKSGKDNDAVLLRKASSSSTVDKVPSLLSRETSATVSQNSVASQSSLEDCKNPVDSKQTETGCASKIDHESVKEKGKGKKAINSAAPGLADQVEKMAKLSVREESDILCEGDTTIIHDVLDAETAKGIFERVRDEVRWQKMSHQGGDVARLVAVQGEIGEDGSIPIYRHPADESPPLLPFSPVVSLIRASVEQKLGHSVNHVLVQFYRDGNDYISEHSDKTLDIVPKTFIANVSLGAQRTMVFRTKKQKATEGEPAQPAQARQATRAPLPHNSMCKMGLLTNMRWLHGIRQDKRIMSEKTSEELSYNGGRISLTFRQIGTFLSKNQDKIWGQGAVSKTKDTARTVINGNETESEKMIRAFGMENQASEFDWKLNYGEGFDVLHIENSPKLFLSGDKVADLRVKLILAEHGIEWREGTLSPMFNWKNGSSARDAPVIPESLPVKFVDNDLSKSTIVGDLAIMLYLDAVYSSTTSAKPPIDYARQFTRLQQCSELLKVWRAEPFSIEPFRKELDLWDGFAAEQAFIAGETISLADYALWPLLCEMSGEGNTFDGLGNLIAYHRRLRGREGFVKAVGAEEEGGDEGEEVLGAQKFELQKEDKAKRSDPGMVGAIVKEAKKPVLGRKKTA